MATGYYDIHGNFIEGATVGGGIGVSTNALEIECLAAASNVRDNGVSAKSEMARLLAKHPVLKSDNWEYPAKPHPLSPLIEYFWKEIFD